jgi:hypothetical protein
MLIAFVDTATPTACSQGQFGSSYVYNSEVFGKVPRNFLTNELNSYALSLKYVVWVRNYAV